MYTEDNKIPEEPIEPESQESQESQESPAPAPSAPESAPEIQTDLEPPMSTSSRPPFSELDKDVPPVSHASSWITKAEALCAFCLLLIVMGIFGLSIQQSIIQSHNQTLEVFQTNLCQLRMENEALRTQLDALLDTTWPEYVYVVPDRSEIPQNEVQSFPENFDKSPFLGVQVDPATASIPGAHGLQIQYVYDYSPAAFAGIQAGDVLMSVDDVPIQTLEDLTAVLQTHQANDTVSIQFITSDENGIHFASASATLTYRGNFDLD